MKLRHEDRKPLHSEGRDTGVRGRGWKDFRDNGPIRTVISECQINSEIYLGNSFRVQISLVRIGPQSVVVRTRLLPCPLPASRATVVLRLLDLRVWLETRSGTPKILLSL